MALRPHLWALNLRMPATKKLVLIALADDANTDGIAEHIEQKHLADIAGCTERQVRRLLIELEDAGLLRREHRQNARGYRIADRYILLLPDIITGRPEEPTGHDGAVLPDTAMSGQEELRSSPLTHPPTEKTPAKRKPKVEVVDPAFEEFWDAYAYKVERPAAIKAWRVALATGVDAAVIIAAARRYAGWVEDKRFQKHPATWLNNACWNDELPARGPDSRSKLQRSRASTHQALIELGVLDAGGYKEIDA